MTLNIRRLFPFLFAAIFMLGSCHIALIRSVAGLGRWGLLFLGAGLALMCGGLKRRPQSIDYVAWVFSGICLLSCLWSITPFYTIQRSVTLILMYVTIFAFLWKWASRHGLESLLSAYMWVIGSIMAVNLLYGLSADVGQTIAGRFRGILENPNTIGMIAALSLPLYLDRLLIDFRRREQLFIGVVGLNLLLCKSRTGLIMALVGCSLIWFRSKSKYRKRLAWPLILVVSIGFFFNAGGLLEYGRQMARRDTFLTLSNRTQFWGLAKEYIRERPNLGHGFGSEARIHDYYGVNLDDLHLRGYGVMSSYYGMVVQLGVLVTILFYSLLFAWVVRVLRAGKKDPLLTVYGSILLSGMLLGITESALYSMGNVQSWFYWSIVMLSAKRMAESRGRSKSIVITSQQDPAVT